MRSFLIMIFFIIPYFSYSNTQQDSLIAHWDFDDDNCLDKSGNNHHASAGGQYYYTDGIKVRAIYLQGLGDNYSVGGHLILPDFDFDNMEEFNISMWVKHEGMSYPHG